jgi:hypothetical protein
MRRVPALLDAQVRHNAIIEVDCDPDFGGKGWRGFRGASPDPVATVNGTGDREGCTAIAPHDQPA